MARRQQSDPKLDMTPMIDVVFELIIFFVVTIKQEDITVNIQIGRRYDGSPHGVILYNSKEVSRAELDSNLKTMARTSKKTPIIIKCTGDSPHKALVDVIDICYRNELYSVSVFSL